MISGQKKVDNLGADLLDGFAYRRSEETVLKFLSEVPWWFSNRSGVERLRSAIVKERGGLIWRQ